MDKQAKDYDTIVQFSSMDGLLAKLYEGAFPIYEVEAAGTIGLGCGDLMDGEMIMDHSQCYITRISHEDYALKPMDKNELTPFAQVAHFKAEEVYTVENLDKWHFEKELINRVKTENLFLGIKVQGEFKDLKLRLAPPARKPYSSLMELFAQQEEYALHNVKGTLIGFWAPKHYQGLTVAGIHIHFIDEEKKLGGHVLDFNLRKGEVAYARYHDFKLKLPRNRALEKADFNHEDKDAAIKQVEG